MPSHLSDDPRPTRPSDPSLEADPPGLTRAARTALLVVAEALSVGFAVWLVASGPALPGYFHDNVLQGGTRGVIAFDFAVALGVAAVAAGAVLSRGRGGAVTLERLARRAAPLALVWMLPFLFDARLWTDRDAVALPFVLAGGFGLVVALRTRWATTPVSSGLARGARRTLGPAPIRAYERVLEARRWLPSAPALVVSGAAGYAVYFSLFTITNHRNLRTRGYDLGIFDNLMWHVLHPDTVFFLSTPSSSDSSHFALHATLLAYAIAPIYALAPRAETLLVLQAIVMGAAAIPLYHYARRHLPEWIAAVVAFAYLLYPPLHGANLFDFHFLSCAPFFLFLTVYALDADRKRLAVVAALLSLLLREDVSPCLAVLGVYLLLSGAKPRAGALLAIAGGVYFAVIKFAVMPHFGHAEGSFVGQYSRLVPPDGSGFGAVLGTILANPAFSADLVLQRDKGVYLLELFAPLLLLPLIRPLGWVLTVPGVVFTVLSSYAPLCQLSFQYTSYWTPLLFIGVVSALEHARRPRDRGDVHGVTRQRSLAVGLVASALAASYIDGAVLQRTGVRSGFDRVTFGTTEDDRRNLADLEDLTDRIARGDAVVASDHLVPHVSNRSRAYSLKHATFDAEWILAEPRALTGKEAEVLRSALGADGAFGVIDVRGAVALAKRGASKDRNDELLERLPGP